MLPARALSTFGDDVALVALTLRVYDSGHGPWAMTALLVVRGDPGGRPRSAAGRLADSTPFRTLAVATAARGRRRAASRSRSTRLSGRSTHSSCSSRRGHAMAVRPGRRSSRRWRTARRARPHDRRLAGAEYAGRRRRARDRRPDRRVAGHERAAADRRRHLRGARLRRASPFARTRGAHRPDTAPEGAGHVPPFRLRDDALLRPLLAGLCLLVLVGEATNVVEVFLLRGTLEAGPGAFGLVAAGLACGLVVGSLAVGRKRVRSGEGTARRAGRARPWPDAGRGRAGARPCGRSRSPGRRWA
jgi:hypothetical protein